MSKHFKSSEFDCKCGCGLNNMQPGFVNRLDMARDLAGIPFTITSGCRCEAHNEAAGGAIDSAHLTGWAADIQCNSSRPRYRILYALIKSGVKRIGVARTFIHADCDPDKPSEVVWMY